MTLILSIETATEVCSVALQENDKCLASKHLYTAQSHSLMLTTLIDDILKITQKTYQDLSAIAVSKGPGSYTGLRIGTATAKGLCYALNIPLLAINSLEAMTWQCISQVGSLAEEYFFCPMIDARRMEVYCLIADNSLQVIENTQAKIIENTSFSELLSQKKVLFFGNGAKKCKEVFANQKNALFIDDFFPNAESVAFLAEKKYQKQVLEDLAYFEPYYLKDFVTKAPKKAKL